MENIILTDPRIGLLKNMSIFTEIDNSRSCLTIHIPHASPEDLLNSLKSS